MPSASTAIPVVLLAYLWFAYNSFLIMLTRAANPVGAFAEFNAKLHILELLDNVSVA
jgi:hypothetical protein